MDFESYHLINPTNLNLRKKKEFRKMRLNYARIEILIYLTDSS